MNRLFYFPYASFTDRQMPLLKVAALYFDKIALLDPVGASWNSVGADYAARDAVDAMRKAGILEVVTPADVLREYEAPIAEAIRRDMQDQEFLDLCEEHAARTGRRLWTLCLAKVPAEIAKDQAMRHLMGDFAREVAGTSAEYRERSGGNPSEYREYAEIGGSRERYQEGYSTDVEYRYAEFPLALGEAIMMNHALFAGLLRAGATPITDDAFHSRALALKLRRAAQIPEVEEVLADRVRGRQLKADRFATTALTDAQLDLPILHPELPLETVLAYREGNEAGLGKVRERLGWLARRIEAEPWSDEFADELEHRTIPDLADELAEAKKERDAWLASGKGRSALKGAGVVVGAASAVLGFVTAPLVPVALIAAGLGAVSGAAIPGVELLMDRKDAKKAEQENGLHYLLKIRP